LDTSKDGSSGAVRAPQLVIPDAEEDEDEADTEDPDNAINNGSIMGSRVGAGDETDGYDDDPMDGSGVDNDDGEDRMAVDGEEDSGDNESNDMDGVRALEELAENEGSVISNTE
jgi:hypothetical protein